jgi:glutaredoxin 2
MVRLFHYIHCPYCVRVRMALGYLNVPYESVPLSYDDEKTPKELTGKKMLPIAQMTSGKYLNESLDIIEALDPKSSLKIAEIRSQGAQMDALISEIGNFVHPLAMPYWVYSYEFTPSAREFMMKQKLAKRGTFEKMFEEADKFKVMGENFLQKLEKELTPFYHSPTLTIKDIMLAAHLWGLYVVPEFRFSDKVNSWLQEVKKQCHFTYHQDFWR